MEINPSLYCLHNFSHCDNFRDVKNVSQPRRIIRIASGLHREAKTLAAAEAITLESLADAILAEGLARRTTDEITRVTLSRPVPSQNRG